MRDKQSINGLSNIDNCREMAEIAASIRAGYYINATFTLNGDAELEYNKVLLKLKH